MCGIAGYYGNGSRQKLETMLDSISHRGPDDRGMEVFDHVALGHNRLSVIELSSLGHQPMYSEDKNLCIVFNGEIYNFQELRKKLEAKYRFRSKSDTEVILNSYLEWGVGCLKHFNGMFSFVIYDLRNNLLFGARDRVGEKPLKYTINKGNFIFASEIKAILSFLDEKVNIDPIAIDNYLTFQYVPSPRTGFKNIYKLPPAHYFIYKDGNLDIKRYWSVDHSEKLDLSEGDWKDLILRELERSVKLRMISDVPMGALLSGGVDSSAVVAFMAKNSSARVKTFSIGFDDGGFDETKYAKIVSEKYNTDHHSLRVTAKELIRSVPKLVDFYDEPIADNSILPTFLVSQLTRQFVTVALNGDGGDENFAGYDRYSIVNFSNFYKDIPNYLKSMVTGLSKNIFDMIPSKFSERMLRFTSSYNEPFYRKYVNYNCFFINKTKQSLYSKEFSELVGKNDSFDFYKGIYRKGYSSLDSALSIDINTYLPDDLLYKTDIASMAFALELRSPLLDPLFMEKMAKMPSEYKIKNGIKKYIFKKALVDEDILPREIVYRKKRGFNIPQNTWFKGPLRDYVCETILSDSMINSNIFNKDKLEQYVNMYYNSNLNYDNNIFSLLMLSNWLNKYEKEN